jgi:HAE1 family hydrophobic/amphiphilic exporter-1
MGVYGAPPTVTRKFVGIAIIQNRVASVVNKLPLVVREGVKLHREESNNLMYINLYSKDPSMDQILIQLTDINILSELKRVDGVGDADIVGNRDYAMRVWLKPIVC